MMDIEARKRQLREEIAKLEEYISLSKQELDSDSNTELEESEIDRLEHELELLENQND